MVYVLNRDGNALMPTDHHGKVRHLLREGKAVVVRRTPFTIRLLYDSTGYVQDVTLGVDAGTTHIGLSATTDTRELFSSEVTLRTDIVNTEYFVFGRRSSGSFDVRLLDGTKVHAGVNCKKLKFLETSRRLLITQKRGKGAIPPPTEVGSILARLS